MNTPDSGRHCSIARTRKFDITEGAYRGQLLIHPAGCCKGCCRRVTLWNEVPLADTDGYIISPLKAHIVFGDGCAGAWVEVDWHTGVQLDLSGEYITVDYDFEVTGSVAKSFLLGAMSACCGAGEPRGDAKLSEVSTFAGAGTNVLRVPPFAYAVQLTSNPATVASGASIQLLANGNPAAIAANFPAPTGQVNVFGFNAISVTAAGAGDIIVRWLIGV